MFSSLYYRYPVHGGGRRALRDGYARILCEARGGSHEYCPGNGIRI